MNNLYEISLKSRKILLIILVILIIIIGIDTYSRATKKTITNNESSRFYMLQDGLLGTIPNFTLTGKTYPSGVNFSIESVHGSFPDVAYVYQIDQPREKLLSYENALKDVTKLGFDSDNATDLGNNDFQWKKDSNTKTLIYNRVLQSWSLSTIYSQNVAALSSKELFDTTDQYLSRAQSFINSMGFDSTGLSSPIVNAFYAKLGGDGVFTAVEETRKSEAGYVYVDAYRSLRMSDLKADADLPEVADKTLIPEAYDAKVYSNDPRVGQLHVVVSNEFKDYPTDVFELKYTDYQYNEKGSYLIITPDEAWTKVQQGEGILVGFQPQDGNYLLDYEASDATSFIADARNTELAYYEPNDYQGFAFPIYVFHGRSELSDGRQASFTFYVNAIKNAK